jgi:hypothetical protein
MGVQSIIKPLNSQDNTEKRKHTSILPMIITQQITKHQFLRSQSASESVCHAISESVCHEISESVCHAISESVCHAISESVILSVMQSMRQFSRPGTYGQRTQSDCLADNMPASLKPHLIKYKKLLNGDWLKSC